MTQTLLLVVLFVGAIACLPWLVRRVQQRQGRLVSSPATTARVLSAVAVGPHQRVVTVEVGTEGERTTLILGVTQQSISCLHTLHTQAAPPLSEIPFSRAMAQAAAVPPDGLFRSEVPVQKGSERGSE